MKQSVGQFSMCALILLRTCKMMPMWEPIDVVCVTGEHCKTAVYYIAWNRCSKDSVTMNPSYVEPKGIQPKVNLQNLFWLTVSDVVL